MLSPAKPRLVDHSSGPPMFGGKCRQELQDEDVGNAVDVLLSLKMVQRAGGLFNPSTLKSVLTTKGFSLHAELLYIPALRCT